MRAFLVPLDVTFEAPLFAAWPLLHPTTGVLVGSFAVADLTAAPVGTYDLGDPLDDVSLRQTTLGNAAANAIAAEFGLQASTIRNKTGARILKFLATKIFDTPAAVGQPVYVAVDWNGLLVDPVRVTD